MVFSDLLRAARLDAKLTQEQLAGLAGLGPAHYARIERGEVEPRLSTTVAIATALGLRTTDLVKPMNPAEEVAAAEARAARRASRQARAALREREKPQARPTTLGLLIRRFREEAGTSQEALAKAAHMRVGVLGRIERGDADPRYDEIAIGQARGGRQRS